MKRKFPPGRGQALKALHMRTNLPFLAIKKSTIRCRWLTTHTLTRSTPNLKMVFDLVTEVHFITRNTGNLNVLRHTMKMRNKKVRGGGDQEKLGQTSKEKNSERRTGAKGVERRRKKKKNLQIKNWKSMPSSSESSRGNGIREVWKVVPV